jgi:hypothetical protein
MVSDVDRGFDLGIVAGRKGISDQIAVVVNIHYSAQMKMLRFWWIFMVGRGVRSTAASVTISDIPRISYLHAIIAEICCCYCHMFFKLVSLVFQYKPCGP